MNQIGERIPAAAQIDLCSPASMRIAFNCFSQRGTGKAHNEDAVLLDGQVHQGRVREQGEVDLSRARFFAVADGVSSGTLPRTASRRLLELLQSRLAAVPATESLSALLHLVQHDYAALGANPDLYGMASTLVGVCLIGNAATIFNVGDSRAYLLANGVNGGQVRLLSRDHSLLNDMLMAGEITADQAENAASILRGLTCQFIVDAEFDEFNVNIVTHELQPGERLLLCSDGLNEVLSDAGIAALFHSNSDDALLNACKAARHAGGTDDFSVIVLTRQD
jgi:PPM family protein phosphatase